MIPGRAHKALPSCAAGRDRGHAQPLLCAVLALACAPAWGCHQDPIVVAGIPLETDAGSAGTGGGGEPAAAGTGGAEGDAGAAGSAAAMAGSAAPTCPEVESWFWLALGIVQRECKVRVTDEDLLQALEQFQESLPLLPSGEERMYEPCDYLAVWFYQNPNDEQEFIVCPSKCLWLGEQVTAMSEARRACLADAGMAP